MTDNEIETRVYTIRWNDLGKFLKRGHAGDHDHARAGSGYQHVGGGAR